MKLPNASEITSVAVTLPPMKFPLASWVAVMVVVPAPTIVTVPLEVTVATPEPDASILYVNAPLLSLVGAVMVNAASPKFLDGVDNVPMVGAIGDTTSDANTIRRL